MTSETDEQRKLRQSLRLLEVLAEEGISLQKHLGWGHLLPTATGEPCAVVLYNDRDTPLTEQAYVMVPWAKVVKLMDRGPGPA